MIISDSAARGMWRPSVGQQRSMRGYGLRGFSLAPPGTLPGAVASCSTSGDCPAGYQCLSNQCVPQGATTPTGVMVMPPMYITASVPTTGIYNASGGPGPSGVASDADLAAASRKRNMMIAGGVAAVALVGWLVLGKRKRGRR